MRGLHGCLAATVTILLALFACSDSTKPPQNPPVTIAGTVLDAEGASVTGASFLLQHAFEAAPGDVGAKPRTFVEFVITEPDTVDIWITSPCAGDTVRVIHPQCPQHSGQYLIFWRGVDREERPVGDGLYRLNIVGRHTDVHADFVFARDDWAALATGDPVAALATTGDDGAFAIDTACLPFGYEFDGVGEPGTPTGRTAISRSVRLWAVIPGQGLIYSDWVVVDAEDGAEVMIAAGS